MNKLKKYMRLTNIIAICIIVVVFSLFICGYYDIDFVFLTKPFIDVAPQYMSDTMIIWLLILAVLSCGILELNLQLEDALTKFSNKKKS